MRIQRADVSDVATLVDISRRTFADTFGHLYAPEDLAHHLNHAYTEAKYQTALTKQGGAAWLLQHDLKDGLEQTVGFAFTGLCGLPHQDVSPNDHELKRIYLLGTHQNQGWGSRLFREAEQWMLAKAPSAIWIGVYSENTAAQRFYQRHGYEQVGTYLYEVGEARDLEFIMRKEIP